MIEETGGVETLNEEMEEFQRVVDRMFHERAALKEKHPNKWVAMGKNGVVAVGDSMDDMFDRVDSQGVRRNDVVVEFLDTDPSPLIL